MRRTLTQHLRAWLPRVAVVLTALFVTREIRRVFLYTQKTIIGDGQISIRYWEVARTSFARGHGFPLWDRSQCAGYPFLGNPETALVSSLVGGLFGVHGDMMERWYPTLFTFLAIIGTYLWGRRVLVLGRPAALFAGCLFAASGFPAGHFAGHMTFVPFALIPWVLLLARLGEDDVRCAAGVGVLLALMAIEGGTYPVPYAIVALAVTEGPRLFTLDRGKTAFKIARLAIVCSAVFFLLAGIKLYPELAQLARHPRHFEEHESLKWTEFFPILLDKERYGGFEGHMYVWDEYRDYIGPLAGGMAIAGVGAAVILKPRRWDLAILTLVSLYLARGHYSDTAPYAELTKLPIFGQLRVPSRYVVLLSLAIGGAGGVALQVAFDRIRELRRSRVGAYRFSLALLAVLGICAVWEPVDATQKLHKTYCAAPWLPRPPVDPSTHPYRVVWGTDFDRIAEYPARNMGAVVCNKPWDYPEGKNYRLDDRPQAWLEDASVGTVGNVVVKQNEYDVDVVMNQPGMLHLIQNHDPDWKSDVGYAMRSPEGQLMVRLPPGTHHVVVRYRPAGLVLGVVTTAIGALLAATLLVFGRRRARAKKRVVAPIAPAVAPTPG